MDLRVWVYAATLGVAMVVASCSSASSGSSGAAPDGGGASGTAGDGGTATTNGLTCLGVLQCAGGCPDADADACVQGCVDQTKASSEPVTEALKECLTTNQCADAECIKTKCQTQLAACLADDASSVAGEPSSGPTPTGAVPAELVGIWGQVGTTSGTSYTFEADGSTIQVFKSKTSYYCESGIDLTSSGVTVVSGDLLVYHRVEGTQVTTSCGTTSGKTIGPADLTYRYALGADDDGKPKLSLYFVDNGVASATPIELHH